jgi:hypothetical protein
MVNLHTPWNVIRQPITGSSVEKPVNLPVLSIDFCLSISVSACCSNPFVATVLHDDHLLQNAFRHLHCTAPASHAHNGAASV